MVEKENKQEQEIEDKDKKKKVAHVEPVHPGDERVGKSRHLLDTGE
ncbi:MAG: hypothetical protein AWU58_2055 [Methanohalophilus sp. T328-1]|jgi:hypothetical protein|uniref:Uncharacterized protein n=1 Tax=Methanohalophilus euhalobius TaxID=51203 RepID=A0A285FTM1_9EURY|nr:MULTISPECIES: hypothetical protein [Methanohalophilus]KXS39377.1 MAG: hypothetical protein AWU58_2055 [Methanohalophilus sp. T328-1]RSD34752.1 MAG: hypothetical protein CI952_1182 [Methanohalophilus sp.]ODV49825.1 MAG: hypothetical protein A8273_877 [Methanohalophilus sp. 2-GBenrich]RSD35177.1 MAG: hypothetical protein CI953_324 [Methanohalophilus sp.]TCL11427.1 hypothetical protein C7960_0578 [Methanohalophilus euhalobius]